MACGPQVFFAGTFEMRYGAQASLLLRGELRPDPAAQEAMQVTVTLPCIDVSP